MSRAKCRAASEFRPKLHSRSKSLSLGGLDRSRAVGRKSLDIPKYGRESQDVPKFGCESLDLGRKSLSKLHSRAESLSLESLDRI